MSKIVHNCYKRFFWIPDYIWEILKKDFEKIWSDFVKTLSNTEAPLKQSAVIQECDTKDESIVHISKILIKLKASRNFMKAKIFINSFFWQSWSKVPWSWSATKSKKKVILISPFFFEITTAVLRFDATEQCVVPEHWDWSRFQDS